jgi:hypothetical protein
MLPPFHSVVIAVLPRTNVIVPDGLASVAASAFLAAA